MFRPKNKHLRKFTKYRKNAFLKNCESLVLFFIIIFVVFSPLYSTSSTLSRFPTGLGGSGSIPSKPPRQAAAIRATPSASHPIRAIPSEPPHQAAIPSADHPIRATPSASHPISQPSHQSHPISQPSQSGSHPIRAIPSASPSHLTLRTG